MSKCDDCKLGHVDFGNCFQCKGNTCEKEVRADERAKVIDEALKAVAFEEKWLLKAIFADKGNYYYNIDMAFSCLKSSLRKLKEQKNE